MQAEAAGGALAVGVAMGPVNEVTEEGLPPCDRTGRWTALHGCGPPEGPTAQGP